MTYRREYIEARLGRRCRLLIFFGCLLHARQVDLVSVGFRPLPQIDRRVVSLFLFCESLPRLIGLFSVGPISFLARVILEGFARMERMCEIRVTGIMKKVFIIAAFALAAVGMVSLWSGTRDLNVPAVTTGQPR
jgi:hypothetical protein